MQLVSLITASITALGLSGCVLDQELSTEVTGFCANEIDLSFEPGGVDSAVATVVVADVAVVASRSDDAQATVDELVFTPTGGVSSLSFAEAIRVDVATRTQPSVRIVDTDIQVTSPLTAPADDSINLVDYLADDAIALQVELTGAMPSSRWSVNLELCMDVRGVDLE